MQEDADAEVNAWEKRTLAKLSCTEDWYNEVIRTVRAQAELMVSMCKCHGETTVGHNTRDMQATLKTPTGKFKFILNVV
jgi:hypothetical protein